MSRVDEIIAAENYREVNERASDGIVVGMYWTALDEESWPAIRVRDSRTGLDEMFCVPPARASDAFKHPFAYAGL